MKLFRWKALIPLALFALAVVLGWTLYVDRLIRIGIEAGGTAVVGAKVDLASARLRLFHGDLVLRGLAVTDPSAPLKNLFETDEIVVDLNVRALLEKKAVADTRRGRDPGLPRTGRPEPPLRSVRRRAGDVGRVHDHGREYPALGGLRPHAPR